MEDDSDEDPSESGNTSDEDVSMVGRRAPLPPRVAVPTAPPAGANPYAFALTPAASTGTRVLDMSSAKDSKIYYNGVKKLMSGESLYDLDPNGLLAFLDMVRDRAKDFEWEEGILMIPDDPAAANPEFHSLLNNYGQISMTRIRAFEESYIRGRVRAAQDTTMMYTCLRNSMSTDAMKTLMLYRQEFTIEGITSGNLFLRVIIRESYLDSNATATVIRGQLAKLDLYMGTVQSDIGKFHSHVRTLLTTLHARGEQSNDLVVNLFNAYAAVTDKKFREYAETKLELHEDGSIPGGYKPEELMKMMELKYKSMVSKGNWNAPSEEEEKLIAMQAEYSKVMKELKGQKKRKGDRTHQGREAVPDPEWMVNNVKPTPASKIMNHKGSPWHWCSEETGGKCQGKWRKHKPSECKGMAKRKETTPDRANAAYPNAAKAAKKLKLLNALQALEAQAEGEEEDEHEFHDADSNE